VNIYFRDATVTTVNQRERLIETIAVPWDEYTAQPVPFEDGNYRERFTRGAFAHLVSNPGRIAVNMGHDRSAIIGKVERLENQPTGLYARMKIADTPAGHDALQLASEDMLAPSVGYYTRQGGYVKNRRAGTVEIRQAWLDHIALVGVPAYTGAQVLAVREADHRAYEDAYEDNTRYLREFRRWQALHEHQRRGDQLQRETEAWLALAAQQAGRRPAPPDLRRRPAITLT